MTSTMLGDRVAHRLDEFVEVPAGTGRARYGRFPVMSMLKMRVFGWSGKYIEAVDVVADPHVFLREGVPHNLAQA